MSLPSRSVGRPVAISMLFVAVILLGLISFGRLPIDLLPDVAYPKLVIYTSYPNVAPAEVERFITQPVESQVSAVPGVERVESVSREGVSLVTLRFAWGTDMDFAALHVRERLDNLRDVLPEQAERPTVLRTDPDADPIMALSVAGSVDLWALKELAESVFKRRLEQIDGVARASVTGGLEREIQIHVDPARLESFGLTIDDLERALRASNVSAPGGTVRRGRFRYSLRTLGELQTVEQVAAVPIRIASRGGGREGNAGAGDAATRLVTVADVAEVRDGFAERQAITRYNGIESVGVLLYKEAGANTVRVAGRVEDVLAELREEYPDVQLDVAMSQAGFVAAAIQSVVDALIEGGVLAFLVLFIFLRDIRYPIAIGLAIPISVIATFALLDAAGVTLNIMSLGGLALGVGMLVDNSIVVLENIFRHREKGVVPTVAAVMGAEEVQTAITSATLTNIAVFGPIIYVEGIAGELFGALTLAVAFSLLASLLVALTLLPMMAARWRDLPSDGPRGRLHRAGAWIGRAVERTSKPLLDAFDRAFARFTRWYENLLATALNHGGRVVALGILLLGISAVLALDLDRSVLPDVDQGSFRVRLELPRGTPLEETAGAARRLETVLLNDASVDAVFTRVGREVNAGEVGDEETGLNTALLEVRLKDGAKTAAALDRIGPELAGFPPGALTIETGQATALGSLLGGQESDLAVRVRGDDLDAALAYARRIEERLHAEPALTNVRLGMELGQPEVRIEIDRERAAAFGIEPRRIAETIEKYMLGVRATDLIDFDRKVPVVIRLPETERHSLATLGILTVDGIPLRELVKTRDAVGPTEIRRIDQSRMVPVYTDVAGGDLEEAITAAEAAIASIDAPRGIRSEIGGENEEMHRNFRDLAFAFGLALLIVYMILAAELESLIHPLTILLSVPLGLVGAFVSLWITGAGLNAMSLIGIIILVGIVDNNAIVMLDFVNQQRSRGVAVREAILEAGRARLRPIIMTTATTLLGVLPMALGIGRGADLRAPLAIAIFGGLFSATALTLVVIPVVYSLVDAAGLRLGALVRLEGPAAVERQMPTVTELTPGD